MDKGKVVFLTISADAKKEIWLKSVRSGLYTTAFSLDLLGDNLISGPSIFKSYNIDNYPTLIVISKSGKLMRNVIDVYKRQDYNTGTSLAKRRLSWEKADG